MCAQQPAAREAQLPLPAAPQPPVIAALAIAAAVYKGKVRLDGTLALWHPLQVWAELVRAGNDDPMQHCAAVLHDTLEEVSPQEGEAVLQDIRQWCGAEVAAAVVALTDDPCLPPLQRKAEQIARMVRAPLALRQLKLADRLANLRTPPPQWSAQKRELYGAHTRALMRVARTAHAGLEAELAAQLARQVWQ